MKDVSVRGYHDLDIQRPPEGQTLMVIQHVFWGVTHQPMVMSYLGGVWRWEPTPEYPNRCPSSVSPTHWRFP